MAIVPKALFINAEYLKQYTPIVAQVDERLIKPHIITAQEVIVRQYLGDALYAKLVDDAPSWAGDYATLMDTYVRDVVAWATVVKLLPWVRVQVKNGTLSQYTSDDATPASESDMRRLVDDARDNFEAYATNMINFLCDNSADYPEYNTSTGSQRAPLKSVRGTQNIDISNGKRYSPKNFCNEFWLRGA